VKIGRLFAIGALALSPCIALAQVGGPVQAGDLAFGLSRSSTTETAQLVRGGANIGGWQILSFMQSMEFDNANGMSHNASGNLLCLNFGATATGGSVNNLSTNGTDAAETFYLFDGVQGNLTRTSGLGVSPDNTKLSVMGVDDGSLYVLDYNAGASIGTGSGASVTGATEAFFAFIPGSSQGTAWLDDDTALVYRLDANFDLNQTQLVTADVSGGGIVLNVVVDDIPVAGTGTSRFTDVEYNPLISPYIYCLHNNFDTGTFVTANTLTVIDPNTWTIAKQIDLSTSMDSSRELALGADMNLYMSAYGGSANPGPWVDIIDLDLDDDGTVDATDTAGLTDNSGVDYYQAVGVSSSFNGLDVAVEGEAPCDPCDANCDGAVNTLDIEPFIDLLLGGGGGCDTCTGDTNGDGSVNTLDIEPFIDCLLGP
jgi:hypothetical protein